MTGRSKEGDCNRESSQMAYLQISDYGVIGDLHTVALVGINGSIDWFLHTLFRLAVGIRLPPRPRKGRQVQDIATKRRCADDAELPAGDQRAGDPVPVARRRCRGYRLHAAGGPGQDRQGAHDHSYGQRGARPHKAERRVRSGIQLRQGTPTPSAYLANGRTSGRPTREWTCGPRNRSPKGTGRRLRNWTCTKEAVRYSY